MTSAFAANVPAWSEELQPHFCVRERTIRQTFSPAPPTPGTNRELEPSGCTQGNAITSREGPVEEGAAMAVLEERRA